MKKIYHIIPTVIIAAFFLFYQVYRPNLITNQDFKTLILGQHDLEYSTLIARQNTQAILKNTMENEVERNGNTPKDVAILNQAKAIEEKANHLYQIIADMQKNIFDYSKVHHQLDKYYRHDTPNYSTEEIEKNFKAVIPLVKIPLEKEKYNSLNSKELYQKIIDFKNIIASSSFTIESETLTNFYGDSLTLEDFKNFNFNTNIAMATSNLARIELNIARLENRAIYRLSQRLGDVTVVFDKYKPFISAESDELTEGMKYKAKMFLIPISSHIKPAMRVSNGSVEIDKDNIGKVRFTVHNPQEFNERGIAKRKWQGSITIKKHNGEDTTFKSDHEYFILKKQ